MSTDDRTERRRAPDARWAEQVESIIGAFEGSNRLLTEQVAGLVIAQQNLAREQQQLRTEIPALVVAGIQGAMGDPATWAAAKTAWRTQARDAAGGMVLGAISGALNKVWMVALVGVLAYSALGWAGLKAIWAAATDHMRASP